MHETQPVMQCKMTFYSTTTDPTLGFLDKILRSSVASLWDTFIQPEAPLCHVPVGWMHVIEGPVDATQENRCTYR